MTKYNVNKVGVGLVALLLIMLAQPAYAFNWAEWNPNGNSVTTTQSLNYEELFLGDNPENGINYGLDSFLGAEYISDGSYSYLYAAGSTPMLSDVAVVKVMAMDADIPELGDPTAQLTLTCYNASSGAMDIVNVYDMTDIDGWLTEGVSYVPITLQRLNSSATILDLQQPFNNTWAGGCRISVLNQDIAVAMYSFPALGFIPPVCKYSINTNEFGFCKVPSQALADLVGVCVNNVSDTYSYRVPTETTEGGTCTTNDNVETGMRGLVAIGFAIFNIMLILTIIMGLIYLIILSWKIFEFFISRIKQR